VSGTITGMSRPRRVASPEADPACAAPVVVGRTPGKRGKSKVANWRRGKDDPISVVALELDLSAPGARRRVEGQYEAAYRLRRALQRDAGARVAAFHAATHERAELGPQAVRERVGLTRTGLERAAWAHLDAARWMRTHLTKGVAQHLADEVWEACDRHLFPDAAGRRSGRPRVGKWFDFHRIPGRARSHTKTPSSWESWRLVGSLASHLDAYAAPAWRPSRPDGLPRVLYRQQLLALAADTPPEVSLLAQPATLPAPVAPVRRGKPDWWTYDGPLAVVFTGLPGGHLVLPVKLPAGAGRWARLTHFLADPAVWHKIDLVRVQDRRAPGGWRYYAHVTTLQPGYTSHATRARRADLPTGRVACVDGNICNLAVVSMPADPHPAADRAPAADHDGLRVDYVTVTPAQRAAALRAADLARGRQRALDRSRRAANPDNYQPSPRQARRAQRRAAAGLPARAVCRPTGGRKVNAAGIPTSAYWRDTLSDGYRRTRADHARDSAGASAAKRARARDVAQQLVARHGANWVTEHVDMRSWVRLWGKGISLFSPGMLLAALATEVKASSGQVARASTFTTALSQQCPCGARAKKPLPQRTHECACGIVGDRDVVAAAMGCTVTFTDPAVPATARVDPDLRAALRRRIQNHPHQQLHQQDRAQQEGPDRSTGTGRTTAPAATRTVPAAPTTPPGVQVPLPATSPAPHPRTDGRQADVTGTGTPAGRQHHPEPGTPKPRDANRSDLRINS
jgi:hypothetical protein